MYRPITTCGTSPSILVRLSPTDSQRPTPNALVHVLSVEERFRVCFTIVDSVHQINELAGEYAIIRVDEFAPDEVRHQIPLLIRALREQLVTLKAALSFDCLSRQAPDVSDAPGDR
jgi:hypothetical protein